MHETFRAAAVERFGESTWALLKIIALTLFAFMTFCVVAVFAMESLTAALLFQALAGLMLLGLALVVAIVNRRSHRSTNMTWGLYRGFMRSPPTPRTTWNALSVIVCASIGLGQIVFSAWALLGTL